MGGRALTYRCFVLCQIEGWRWHGSVGMNMLTVLGKTSLLFNIH